MTRFDIPETVANVVRKAMAHGVIDAIDVFALAVKHGTDWKSLVDEICEIAFTLFHSVEGREKHKAVVMAAEEFWMGFAE